jgi:hypothetical protein
VPLAAAIATLSRPTGQRFRVWLTVQAVVAVTRYVDLQRAIEAAGAGDAKHTVDGCRVDRPARGGRRTHAVVTAGVEDDRHE